MAQRPRLTESSFLAAIFKPKNNPTPVGLRKRTLTGLKGRKRSRLKSYNSMSALNQRVLEQAGKREQYLRGEITLADAKRALRNRAVELGITKPLRARTTGGTVSGTDKRTQVLVHLWNALTKTDTKQPVNLGVLRRGTLLMSPDDLDEALTMTAPDIKRAAGDPNRGRDIDGKVFNPYWYH